MTENEPNPTLYIQNLNNRINVIELKKALYCLFGSYGEVIDVKVRRTEKLREQAFLSYTNITSATTALRGLNGFVFYGKPLKIFYAKEKADAVAKLDGTFKLRNRQSTTLGKRTAGDEEHEQHSKLARNDSESDDDSE
ncbi:hypothetical protein BJ944DRAFT_169293 [Cunninghamella echinulata]|nr:hypothetical protein BJ944DRAFT_169293 [Cunninghamella echinulata]